MAKLKTTILTSLLILGFFPLQAQVDYRFSQFMQNPLPVNPAFSGIEDFVDLKFGYRAQWLGFEGAPTNIFLSGNMALQISPGNNFKDRGVRIYEPEAYNEKETDNEFGYRKGKRQGVSFYILQNSDGGFFNIGSFVNYAYHLRITNQLLWSVGAGVGYEFSRFDAMNISVLNPLNDPTYQAYVANNQSQKSNLKLNLGTVIYHKQLFIGYSALNAVDYNIGGNNEFFNEQTSDITHTVQAGLRYKWRYGYLITPSLLVRIRANNPTEYIGLIRARWHDKAWAGIQYTYNSAVGLSLGTYLTKNIGFNYAYEFPTSQVRRASSGSHEFILAIKLNNQNFSRAYLW